MERMGSGAGIADKTILHLDMNSYFATVEQQANPYLRGKPVGIIKAEGRGCIIAASMEAKKFGVGTGSNVWEARRLCPQIILVPADMDKYFGQTKKLISIAKHFSPDVEVFSIDEVFLDVTESQKCFAGGVLEVAYTMKQKIYEDVGEWVRCSIGVSFNRLAAKLASEMEKPNGLVFLTRDNYLKQTEGLGVDKVCGIGRSRTRFLLDRGLDTLGKARSVDLPAEIGRLVWLKDDSKLTTDSDLSPAKSVSRTFTTFANILHEAEIERLVRNLVEEATSKLREMNMVGRTICLFLRGGEENFWLRQTLRMATADPQIVFGTVWKKYKESPLSVVRFAGLAISNLSWNFQLSIIPQLQRRSFFLKAADQINSRFGLFTVYSARLLGGELIRPEVTGFLGDKWYRLGGLERTRTSTP